MGKMSNKSLFKIVSALLCVLGFSSCARKQLIETDPAVNTPKIVTPRPDSGTVTPRPIDKPVYGPPAAYYKEKIGYIDQDKS